MFGVELLRGLTEFMEGQMMLLTTSRGVE
jgi:hypothetical protein